MSAALCVIGCTGFCCSQVQNGYRQNCGYDHWHNQLP